VKNPRKTVPANGGASAFEALIEKLREVYDNRTQRYKRAVELIDARVMTIERDKILDQEFKSPPEHILESADSAHYLADDQVAFEDKANFLYELREELLTETVLAEFAKVFGSLMRNPGVEKWAEQAIDVCGTGGDHSGSYNISTTVAFIVAAAGVPVFKHGNRASTSKSGSAEFLQVNGIPLEAPDEVWREALAELNFAFFFAPAYHPAFKHVAPIRKKLGEGGRRRTIFNLLGPMLNPGKPEQQLMGVYRSDLIEDIAGALELSGVKCGLVVNGSREDAPGRDGIDELTVTSDNSLSGIGKFRFLDQGTLLARPAPPGEIHPRRRDLVKLDASVMSVGILAGIGAAPFSDLAGGDAQENLLLLNQLLHNQAKPGLRDTVLLNAAAALWISGKANDLKDGISQARELLTGGAVEKWLARAREFFADRKFVPAPTSGG
jgi:anthranilate phosphoribosyltransferase